MTTESTEFQLLLRQAEHYYEIGHFGDAKRIFLQALEMDPTSSDVLMHLGLSTYYLKQYDESRDFCARLLELGYDSAGVHEILGKIHELHKEYAKAEAEYLKGLAIRPDFAVMIGHYAHLMLITGHEEKAEALFEEALRLDPNDSTILEYKYIFDTYRRNFRKREETTREYIQSDADEIGKLLKSGSDLYRKKKFKDAREQFRQAVLLDPMNQTAIRALETSERILHPLYWPSRMLSTWTGRIVGALIAVMAVFLTRRNPNAQHDVYEIIAMFFIYRAFIVPRLYKMFFATKRR